MLEKSALDHEAIRRWNFPKTVGQEGRHQREAGERKRTKPAIKAGENQRSADQLGRYRCEGQRDCRRETELLHFGDRAGEVYGLVEAALEPRTSREALSDTRAAF